jgi:hypothetical protein
MAHRISRITFYTSRLTVTLPRLVVAASLFAIALYLVVASTRILYPYAIDFVEDGLLMQSLRVAEGQPVFVAPNADFVPHVYMPLYAWLGGLLFKIAGPGFAPLRLMSFAATLTTTALISVVARRESRQPWIGVACAGLYLGGYDISGGWYELARVDALFAALALGGAVAAVYGRSSTRALIGSGVLLALSFLAKQNGIVIALAVGLYLLVVTGRRAWPFWASFVAVGVVPVGWLHFTTEGWFSTYVFGIAYASPIEFARILGAFRYELFGSMAVLTLGLVILVARVLARRLSFEESAWLVLITVAVVVSWVGRASVGGNLNNLMIGYAFLCLIPSLLTKALAGDEGRKTKDEVRSGHSSREAVVRRAKRSFVAALVILQFALGVYNPLRFIPTPEMRAAGDRLVERIASIDGPVLVLLHPYYARLAGKEPGAQIAALWHARWRGRDPLPDDLIDRLQRGYYAAIVSDETLFETDPPLRALIEAHYTRSEILADAESPPVLAGMFARPRVVYVPRN